MRLNNRDCCNLYCDYVKLLSTNGKKIDMFIYESNR